MRRVTASRICPHCGHHVELHTGISGASEPHDGDVSLCISCGAVSIFADGCRALRLRSEDESRELYTDPLIAAAQWLIRSRRVTN